MQAYAVPRAEGLPQMCPAARPARNRPAGPSGSGPGGASQRRVEGDGRTVSYRGRGSWWEECGGIPAAGATLGSRQQRSARPRLAKERARALAAGVAGVSAVGCLANPWAASAVEAGASVVAAAAAGDAPGEATAVEIATLVSFIISGVAGLLYTPQIARLVRDPAAAAEVAPATFALKLFGYSLGVLYGQSRGLPLPVYLPDWVLLAQVGVINAQLITASGVCKTPQGLLALDRNFQIGAAATAIPLVLAIAGVIEVTPEEAAVIPVINTGIFVSSLVPQFLRNMRSGTMGAYSPVVAGTAGAGTAVRLASAATLTDDAPLLVALFVGVILNLGLFSQILYYGIRRQGFTISDVLLGDFKSQDAAPAAAAAFVETEEPCEVAS